MADKDIVVKQGEGGQEGHESEIPVKEEEEDDKDLRDSAFKGGDNKAQTTIVTQRTESNAKDDCSDLTDNINDNDEQAPKTFPQKLMDILSSEEHAHIISWLPHGNGFVIHKKKTFANEVLPKYFKASKFTSFTRKLNRWGFSRVPRGPETGSYYHKLFRRDKADMCLQMTSNSGNKHSQMPMSQHLLPSMPGMGPAPAMPMFPFAMAPQMMTQMSPQQQQQMMWQQQMQQMMQFQQMMMQQQQMQPQQQQSMAQNPMPMQMMPAMMPMQMMPMAPMPQPPPPQQMQQQQHPQNNPVDSMASSQPHQQQPAGTNGGGNSGAASGHQNTNTTQTQTTV